MSDSITSPLRIAFMGSPDIAVSVLEALIEAGHEIVCVYSQPPRPAGRGKKLRPTPVHAFAEAAGLEVRTPLSLKSETEQAAFAALDLDAAVVVAYGLILPQPILDAPRLGCLNMHASILPRWRGAAPIQRAIMAGDTETGIDAMLMDAGLDTGPVLQSARTAITHEDTAASLHDRLAALAADLAPRALAGHANGSLQPHAQPDEGITYAHKITAADQAIDWTESAESIDCQIRGLSPHPGAYCFYQEEADRPPIRLKVLMSEALDIAAIGKAGQVLDDELLVACGDGAAIRILSLQKPGGKPLSARDFLRGTAIMRGAYLQSAPILRPMNEDDVQPVMALNRAAFGGDEDARIVQALQRTDDDLGSFVIQLHGEIIAHIQAFRILIDGAFQAVGIGPMAVAPEHQQQGHGAALMRAMLQHLKRKRAHKLVFVLGHADYYPRFGFSAELAKAYTAPWTGDAFMALQLREDAPAHGDLTYPDVFFSETD